MHVPFRRSEVNRRRFEGGGGARSNLVALPITAPGPLLNHPSNILNSIDGSISVILLPFVSTFNSIVELRPRKIAHAYVYVCIGIRGTN